ncbi:hypothetical protein RHSIM_Rhsim04G0167700 [Rhododendron simsii]|uniref:Protein kinase domain-containing protein n=1 Tax=Rhododendron simsii TaxID=118357 RepID=A0A834GYN3_RHOSS|nr:hypothetical protein RHSIM_Rhsim04G0167700 [Rhododendron simsii]
MAKPFQYQPLNLLLFFFFLLFMVVVSIPDSDQLQSSQSHVLSEIQQLLNYPQVLSTWNQTTDFCNTEPNPSLTLVCYGGDLTQLHIISDNCWLPQTTMVPQSGFSSDSFFSTLSTLPSLKVLSLVCLGLWGPLPASIGRLSSLEILNMSSNHFSGPLPQELSSLSNLQTLILDHNNFTGRIPAWLVSLPLLAVLSLDNNSLSGLIPFSFTRMENLRVLSLSMNRLSGEVPDLQNLTNLQVLDVGYNELGPHFPKLLHTNLLILVLRKNKFSFGIPEEISSCYRLQQLDISFNGLTGPFLAQLLSLPSLSYLDISDNKFTGVLYENTSCNAILAFVNLSSNYLTGELPRCLQSNSSTRVVQYSGNCLSQSSAQEQHPYSFCRIEEALAVKITPHERERKSIKRSVLASSSVGGIFGGIALCVVLFLGMRKVYAKQTVKTPQATLIVEKVPPAYTMKMLSDARYISETMKFGGLGLPPYRTFSLEELKEATSNFSSLNFIGEGSQGKVYKGILTDGTLVAIRSLKMRKRHGIQSYRHQIELISRLRHRHLVSFVGHSFECYPDDSSVSTIFLVQEFVPNGTLRSCISEVVSGHKCTWTQRIAAAIGVARGIQFLHTGIVPGVFSNDLKITDVLLDHELHVKINNYNLPLLAENRIQVCSGAVHTGPKEQNRGTANGDKNDVYDMGVILLEIIVGRVIMCQSSITIAKDLLQVSLTTDDDVARRSIVDPAIHKECSDESLKNVMEICVRCLSSEPTDRPTVEDVLWNLQFAAQVQDLWRVDSNSNQGSPFKSTE